MTDLERMARQHASKMAAEIEDGIRKGVSAGGGGDVAVNEHMVAYLERQIEYAHKAARLQGRIEGLEEAAGLCRLVRDGLMATTPETHEIWVSIRARIKELKGE